MPKTRRRVPENEGAISPSHDTTAEGALGPSDGTTPAVPLQQVSKVRVRFREPTCNTCGMGYTQVRGRRDEKEEQTQKEKPRPSHSDPRQLAVEDKIEQCESILPTVDKDAKKKDVVLMQAIMSCAKAGDHKRPKT